MSGLLMIIFLSDTFTGMVMGRFLQGLGTGCCAVLARASTRDRFSGDELPVAMSYIAMAASITPLIAPVIGGFILPLWLEYGVHFTARLCLTRLGNHRL